VASSRFFSLFQRASSAWDHLRDSVRISLCRIDPPAAFAAAVRETNIWYGTINTAILLTSSLTMAVAA
jgi:heme/copper-type cytochrome/quinol oxidase subunit 3